MARTTKSRVELADGQDSGLISGKLAVWLVLFLLYFPKINLVPLLAPGVGLKPEDIICGLAAFVLALMALRENRIARIPRSLGNLGVLLLTYIAYLALVTAVFGGDFLYVARYIGYYAMLLFGLFPAKPEVSKMIERIAFQTLIVYVMVGALQKYELVGGFHTGTYVSEAGDRVPIIFANATEVGLISVILVALVMRSSRGTAGKTAAMLAAAVLNLLGGNRTASLALLVVGSIYVVGSLGKDRATKIRDWVSRPVACGTVLVIVGGVLLALVNSADWRSGNVQIERIVGMADVAFGQIESGIQPTDISEYTVGRGVVWDVDADESLILRLQKWTYVVNLLLSGFVFGIGAGNGIGGAMDGFAFRLLIESGYLGLVLYIGVLLGMFRIVNMRGRFLNGLGLAVISVVVQGAFLDSFYFSRVGYLLWLMVGLKASAVGHRLRSVQWGT